MRNKSESWQVTKQIVENFNGFNLKSQKPELALKIKQEMAGN